MLKLHVCQNSLSTWIKNWSVKYCYFLWLFTKRITLGVLHIILSLPALIAFASPCVVQPVSLDYCGLNLSRILTLCKEEGKTNFCVLYLFSNTLSKKYLCEQGFLNCEWFFIHSEVSHFRMQRRSLPFARFFFLPNIQCCDKYKFSYLACTTLLWLLLVFVLTHLFNTISCSVM